MAGGLSIGVVWLLSFTITTRIGGTLMSKLQSKRLMRTMKAPVRLSLGGGSMGTQAFSGRAPIRKPCTDDITGDTVRRV